VQPNGSRGETWQSSSTNWQLTLGNYAIKSPFFGSTFNFEHLPRPGSCYGAKFPAAVGAKMDTFTQQVTAVWNAPIPFVITLIPLGVVVWRIMEWAYRAILNKRQELYAMSKEEVDRWKNRLEATTQDLNAQIKDLREQVSEADPSGVKPRLDQMTHSTGQLEEQLNNLAQANTVPNIRQPWLGGALMDLIDQSSRRGQHGGPSRI
jgi:hypothetical protein